MTESLGGAWVSVCAAGREEGGVHLDVDIVARDDLLAANGHDLNLDVDDADVLRAGVDLHQTGVHRLVELAEAGDEPDGACRAGQLGCLSIQRSARTLLDIAVGVRARATGHRAEQTDAVTEQVQHGTIDTMVDLQPSG